ncbi:efflux RND transporter permease subunit [Hyphomicrobium sp. 2TAF46]|uniref:efflux RND transporter permease subunit n=1 Tax=Hyphomicrobium sp. 2TAF46 TaxID=3233019 RepID=UPI003F90FC8E
MFKLFIEQCIERRSAIVFMTLILAAFGVHAYLRTAIEAYPDVTNAQVQVITQMPGYAAEEIERQITVPLERALNGTPGMTLLRSENLFGLSIVTLIFADDADPFISRMVVAQRMSGAELPEGVTPSLAPEATPLGKIFRFRLQSDAHDLYQLRSEMQWNVTRVLRQVQGVADVVPFGGFLKELHVEVDPSRLYAAGLTIRELEDAITKANLNVGGGFLRQGDQELTIRGIGLLQSAEDIKKIPLKSKDGSPLTISDIATVKMAATPRRGSVAWNDSKEVVEGLVLMRRGENPSVVLDGIHQKVDELNNRILPKGMRIDIAHDRSVLVEHTLATVHENLLHGFILVVAVVWLFLRSVVGSAIVSTVIPLSLLVAFIGLYSLGLPANLISMGAIDFGILVDGAVVLVESVFHALNAQRPKTRIGVIRLIVQSAVSVGRPTLYSMLIIIAALMPVFTLESVEGRMFRPLALTYAFALAGALVFSLALIPALCAFAFRPKHAFIEEPRWLIKLREMYRDGLARLLANRSVTLTVAAVLLLSGVVAARNLGTEFLPELDEGDIAIFVEMPASISMEKAQEILLDVHGRLQKFSEVSEVHTEHGRPEDGTDNEGVNMLKTFVKLRPEPEWETKWTKPQLVQAMRSSLAEIKGVRFNFSQPIKDSVEEAVSGVRGKVVLKIFGDDLELMRSTLLRAKAVIEKVDGVTELDLYRDAFIPQLQIHLNRQALARSGIAIEDAARTIETALAGRVATQLWEGERPVPVRLILAKTARDDIEKLNALSIPTPSGGRVSLKGLADIKVASGAASIVREGNVRFLALKFNVKGRDMGSVVREAIETLDASVTAPDGHYFVWGGEFENQNRAAKRLMVIVPLAVVLVLVLLYAAMNSLRNALLVLATVPFAITGGIFTLLLTGTYLSVSAAIGFIALLGQISLMGVLVLSAIDEFRHSGVSVRDAIVAGSVERLRAVLMASTLAMLGLLPMALSTSVGSETQRPFALVIVGGMVTTLIIALFVLPVFYSLFVPREVKSKEIAL